MAKPESSTSHPHWPPHSATCLPTSPLKPKQTRPFFCQPNLFTLLPFSHKPLMMSDRSKPTTQMLSEAAPSSRQTVKFLTAATIAGTFLLLSGLTLTGTVIALVLATPVLVLLCPILLPAGITLLLTAAGVLFSGGCGVAAVSTLVWIYNYVKGKHPIGADQLDYARDKIVDKARDVKEKTKEYGQLVQQKAQAATQGSA